MANITRIKNNQITDNTIEYQKIKTGTLVGVNFNANLTLNSNVTILGNLTVANSFAQLNSINTYINDPLVVFNNNYTGSPSYDVGMLVNRNLNSLAPYGAVNAAFVWKETDSAFAAVMTTETGTTAGSINNTGWANVKVGNLTAVTATINGSLSAGSASFASINSTPIGNATPSTGNFSTLVATNLSTGNAVISGGYISALTNAAITTATLTNTTVTNFYTANARIQGGYIQNLANVTAALGFVATLNATAGNITTLQVNNLNSGNAAITGAQTYIGTGAQLIANIYAGTGYFTNFSGANVEGVNGDFTTLTAANFSTPNAAITGTQTYIGTGATPVANIYVGTGYASNFSTPNAVVTTATVTNETATNFYTANARIAGGYIQNLANITAATGFVATLNATAGNITTLVATNFSTANAQVTGGTVTGLTNLTATTTQATNFSTANAQITGTGSYLGTGASLVNSVYGTTGYFTNLSTSNLSITTENVTTSYTQNFSSPNAVVTGGSLNNSPIGNTTPSTAAVTTLTASGLSTITNITQSTVTGDGALVVSGGVGIAKNLNVGGDAVITGNLTVQGVTTTLNTSTLDVEDLNITVAKGAATPAAANGAGLTVEGAAATILYTSATDSWNLNKQLIGTGANFSNATITTGPTTGALVVTGGVGIGGDLYAYKLNATHANITTGYFGSLNTANAQITGGTSTGLTNLTATTTQATNFSSGNIAVTGGYAKTLANVYATEGYFTNLSSANISGVANGNFTTLVASNFSTPNAVVTTSTVTNETATNFYTANARIAGGYIQNLANITAGTGFVATLNSTAGNVTTLVATNFSTANAQVTGGTVTGLTNLTATTTQATNFSTANAQITGTGSYFGTGASLVNSVYGTTGYFTNFSSANIDAITNLDATTSVATNFSTANARITGGYITGLANLSATLATFTNLGTANAVITGGSLNNSPIGNTTPNTGAFTTLVNSGVHTSNGNLVAASQTNSTSITTGALTVVGGAGVAANVFVGGATTLGSNRTAGYDTVTQGKNDATLIWARSGNAYDQVVIGNSATVSTLVTGAKLIVNSTDSMLIPVGTNAQRPDNIGGTAVAGMLRFNTTTNAPEYHDGTEWSGFATNLTVITDEQFTGDGVTVDYTLAQPTTTASTVVSINGVLQIPTLAYSCSGAILTFTEAPAIGDLIDVRRLVTTSTVGSLASVNGYMQVETDNQGVRIYTGSTNTSITTYWEPTGAKVTNLANVAVATANTATTIDTLDTTKYRSAKYTIQVTNGANYQVQEALVISNGTTATITTYGVISTNGNLGVVEATQSGSSALVQFIATNATNNVRITKDYTPI